MKKVFVIDNYDSFTYNLVHYLEELDCNVTVKRNDEFNLDEIEEMRWSEVSLMPEGLLLGLSDQEVADLLAYLRSL